MAKKIKIPAQDIIDVILSRKDEIVKAVNPKPTKVLELRERDGVTYSRYLCGHCKEEFNDFYAEEVSIGYYHSETHYYCPFCMKELPNKLFNDNKMDSEAFIAIQVDRKIYFAEAIISFEYNDALNVINTDFSFKALSVFDLDTNDKSSYRFNKETNEFVYTTAMLTSLLCYVGIWYADETKRPKFIDVTDDEFDDKNFVKICRQLDGRKKKMLDKKEVVLPIELDDDSPCPALTDCINIAVTQKENDKLEKTTTYKAHCLHCNKEWLFNVDDCDADGFYNSSFLAECPYCGTAQQIKRGSYYSTRGGHDVQTWIYISDNSHEAIVKVVSVFIEKNTLHPKVQAALSGYYVFNQKGVCNGFHRHIDMSSRSLFSGAKEYSLYCAPWYTAKFDAKYAETPLHKVICNLSDDGILKYSGIKEFISQQPRRRLGYNSGTGAMTTREFLMFINKTLKYPVAEKLAKEGFANEILDADKTAIRKNTNDTAIAINWKAKTAAEAFGITPSLLKYYKSAKKELGCDITMQTLQRLFEIDNDIIGEDAYWCDKHNVPIESIVKIQKVLPLSVSKITSYLERVRIGQMFDPIPAAEQWRDYLGACKSIDMDMTDRHVLYPRALKTEHDIVMSKQKFIADESLNDDFVKSVDKYRFLEYHKDDYFIKVPESMQSMFEEGRKLNHCCGRYVDDVIDKQAFILFLRRKDNPDTPFLSIEVSPDMTVHQVRGVNDTYVSVHKDAKAINMFLQSWARMKHLCLDIR